MPKTYQPELDKLAGDIKITEAQIASRNDANLIVGDYLHIIHRILATLRHIKAKPARDNQDLITLALQAQRYLSQALEFQEVNRDTKIKTYDQALSVYYHLGLSYSYFLKTPDLSTDQSINALAKALAAYQECLAYQTKLDGLSVTTKNQAARLAQQQIPIVSLKLGFMYLRKSSEVKLRRSSGNLEEQYIDNALDYFQAFSPKQLTKPDPSILADYYRFYTDALVQKQRLSELFQGKLERALIIVEMAKQAASYDEKYQPRLAQAYSQLAFQYNNSFTSNRNIADLQEAVNSISLAQSTAPNNPEYVILKLAYQGKLALSQHDNKHAMAYFSQALEHIVMSQDRDLLDLEMQFLHLRAVAQVRIGITTDNEALIQEAYQDLASAHDTRKQAMAKFVLGDIACEKNGDWLSACQHYQSGMPLLVEAHRERHGESFQKFYNHSIAKTLTSAEAAFKAGRNQSAYELYIIARDGIVSWGQEQREKHRQARYGEPVPSETTIASTAAQKSQPVVVTRSKQSDKKVASTLTTREPTAVPKPTKPSVADQERAELSKTKDQYWQTSQQLDQLVQRYNRTSIRALRASQEEPFKVIYGLDNQLRALERKKPADINAIITCYQALISANQQAITFVEGKLASLASEKAKVPPSQVGLVSNPSCTQRKKANQPKKSGKPTALFSKAFVASVRQALTTYNANVSSQFYFFQDVPISRQDIDTICQSLREARTEEHVKAIFDHMDGIAVSADQNRYFHLCRAPTQLSILLGDLATQIQNQRPQLENKKVSATT